MTLIHSYSQDETTNLVIDWLLYSKSSFLRINSDKGYTIEINDFIKIENVDINTFSSYWFRKGRFRIQKNNTHIQEDGIKKYLDNNEEVLSQYVEYMLKQKININSFYESIAINKLIVLEVARKNGLKIPLTKLLSTTLNLDANYIYKTINDSGIIYLDYGKSCIKFFTNLYFKTENINYFAPTLFQEKINKKYELRIFYFHQKFYAMAIFSQKDKLTEIDFRHYNRKKPNRVVPFKLNELMRAKLSSFMEDLNLNSGSIDMIVTNDDNYIFLEVNPVGQFGMVSYPCNYYIEKEIANFLKNE